MNRVALPIGYHRVQDLVPGGAGLAGQQVASIDDGAAGELDADCLPLK